MNQIKYYYRLEPIAIDNWDEHDIKKYNRELNSFDDLSKPFEFLKKSYETLTTEPMVISVCITPDQQPNLNNVIEINVFHYIKRKLFSKEIKKHCFRITLTATTPDHIDLYSYETTDFDFVKQIFYNYIVNQQTPDTSLWKVLHC
jgi:hypothetical protein